MSEQIKKYNIQSSMLKYTLVYLKLNEYLW